MQCTMVYTAYGILTGVVAIYTYCISADIVGSEHIINLSKDADSSHRNVSKQLHFRYYRTRQSPYKECSSVQKFKQNALN